MSLELQHDYQGYMDSMLFAGSMFTRRIYRLFQAESPLPQPSLPLLVGM